MKLSYVRLYGDASETVDLLSDTEAGRLFKAVLHYAKGQEDELPGQEKLIYSMLRAQFERDAASYDDYIDKQRENGKKGGRPKKASGLSGNPENPSLFSETQKRQYNNHHHPKDHSEDNNHHEDHHHHEDDDDARARINSVEVYAANNLNVMSPGNMEELASFKTDLPDGLIRYAIDEACANGAPRWAYVSAILRGYVRDGIKSVGDAKAAKDKRAPVSKGKTNPATQNFAERGYTDKDYGDDFFIDLAAENAAEKGKG